MLVVLALWSRDARAQITVSGSPAELTINAATAGSAPAAVQNSSTTYTVKKPASGSYEVTAALNLAMPTGVTLTVQLAANNGAASAGAVTLGTMARTVVTGITKKISAQPITYTLSATPAAGVVRVQTRVVTLTCIAMP